MQEPWFNLEEKDYISQHIKRSFFIEERSIFISVEPELFEQSNESSWVLPALKSTSQFLPKSTAYGRSDASLEPNSRYCHNTEGSSIL